MDDSEVKQYKKPIQQYSQRLTRMKPTPSTTPPITTPKGFAMAVKYIESVADHAAFAHQPEVKLQEYAFVGGKIWDEDLKKFAAWKDLANHPNTNIAKRWTRSGVNEFARLFQGYKHIEGLDVLEWIDKHEVPPGQKVTYPRYTIDYRPEKDEPFRTRITAGGNLLDFFGNTTTHSASMETIKCH